MNQSIAYQIYATMGAFYIPVSIMLFVNWKIFTAAREMAEKDRRISTGSGVPPPSAALLGEQMQLEEFTESQRNKTMIATIFNHFL